MDAGIVIEVSASNSPPPGGSSVSAMVAGFSVAMAAMDYNQFNEIGTSSAVMKEVGT